MLSPLVLTPGHEVLYKSGKKWSKALTVSTVEEAAMQGDSSSRLLG